MRVRRALVLCAAWVLAACAPVPVTPVANEAGRLGTASPSGPGSSCRPESETQAGCQPDEAGAAGAAGAAAPRTPPRAPRGSSRTAAPVPAPSPAPDASSSPPSDAAAAGGALAEPPRDSDQQGLASWYGPGLHGRRTASGERFDRYELTAAHRTLPFGSRVCVRSSVTGRTVVVRINDRGPFSGGRVIDLSQAAAQELGMTGLGIKPVELWLLGDGEEACPDALLDASAWGDASKDEEGGSTTQPAARRPQAAKSRVAARSTARVRQGSGRR